jgi:hypothetical protein
MRTKKVAFISLLVSALFLGLSGKVAFASSLPRVTIKEATLIAKNFVAFNSVGHFPSWQEASQFNAERIFSSDGFVVSYEVSVRSAQGKALGFAVVAAQKGFGQVVTAFTSEGEPVSRGLWADFSRQVQPFFVKNGLKPLGLRLIGTDTGAYAIGVKASDSTPSFPGARLEGDYYLFSTFPDWGGMSFTYLDKRNLKLKSPADAEYREELELREALLAGDFSSALFQEESSGAIRGIDKGSGSISGTFSSFEQENAAWTKGGLTNGKCLAGCAPVAWAIVLEYWDRNGYSKLISTAQDNSNTSTTDPDVHWTINELRGTLNTVCSPSNQGGTAYPDMPKGASYAKSRGYSNSSASNTSGLWSAWWDLLSAVGSGKPPIAALDLDGNGVADHAAVVFSYIDNWGTTTDSYCVRTGWNKPPTSPPSLCYTTQNKLTGLTSITVK